MKHSQAFVDLVHLAKKQVKECSLDDVLHKQSSAKAFVLVDTREDSEWELGRIPGSMHIGKGVIERDIESKIPNKDQEVILYCGGGYRSALAALNLQQMGYENVISMDGGFKAYKDSGLEIEK
jgi:rhodanese-related sulfurtransferase